MSLNFTPPFDIPDQSRRLERNSFILILATSILALVGISGAVAYKLPEMFSFAPLLIAGMIGILILQSGRYLLANWTMILVSIGMAIFAVINSSGTGFLRGTFVLFIIAIFGIFATPINQRGRTLLFALASGAGIVLLDSVLPSSRPPGEPPIQWVIITSILILISLYLVIKEFPQFDLLTKVTFGILLTSGLILGALSYFAIVQSGILVNTLSNRLETTVVLLAEEQLINKVENEANIVNGFFDDIASQTVTFSETVVSLNRQESILDQGAYWDAQDRLIQFEEGQYGNFVADVSSVFVPSSVELNDAVIRDLNASAYLDFSVPQSLNDNPALLAVYFIDNRGVVRYYPNINLASLLPPDFDATKRPYYEINAPGSNPDRSTKWTIPYVDATGAGLVVTVANPIYINGTFNGVVAADVQLTTITDQVSTIHLGQTGYSFLLDDGGRIISMPQAGYDLYGINPDEFDPNEFASQTVIGRGSDELASNVTTRMIAGESGLTVMDIKGIPTFVAYSPVVANGYSLAVVVPVSEMQSALEIARNEVEIQRNVSIRTGALIIIILLLVAVLFSLALGRYIVSPITRLTMTANRILEGELSAQANVNSFDETGTLARAFNSVTSRLRDTLSGLEKNIEERTVELIKANEQNVRRARQFQSISRVAQLISSTLDLNSLLTQISNVISREFGFYHVGLFLIDSNGEYAILSAANSEGGQTMLENGHKLKVGEKGIVGYTAGSGRARVALDTGKDAVYFDNPFLPNTRSEIALPLRAADKIIGVLDVQSVESNAFSEEDVNILSALAEQVSVAIRNARQNQETQRALAESEVLSKQFVKTGWEQFTAREKVMGIHNTGTKSTMIYSEGNNGNLLNKSPRPTTQNGRSLSLPIKLREQVIGAVEIQAPEDHEWEKDEIDIITAIIERSAVALENARLLAESQRRIAKERAIGNISALISSQQEMEDLIKTTTEELNRTLPGTEVTIQFRGEKTE